MHLQFFIVLKQKHCKFCFYFMILNDFQGFKLRAKIPGGCCQGSESLSALQSRLS